MKKMAVLIALALTLAACSDDDSPEYRYDFATGTYEMTGVTVDGGAPDATSSYALVFSIDKGADRIVLLEAMALYVGGRKLDVEFDYRADDWNYKYSRWDQPFDNCGEMTGNTLTCTERENGRTLTYTINKVNDSFDAARNLLAEPMLPTDVTIDNSNNNGLYGLVGYQGSTCRVEGELSLNGTNAQYDLDLERGCPEVRDLEGLGAVTVGSWNNGLLPITVGGYLLTFKKFNDTPLN